MAIFQGLESDSIELTDAEHSALSEAAELAGMDIHKFASVAASETLAKRFKNDGVSAIVCQLKDRIK